SSRSSKVGNKANKTRSSQCRFQTFASFLVGKVKPRAFINCDSCVVSDISADLRKLAALPPRFFKRLPHQRVHQAHAPKLRHHRNIFDAPVSTDVSKKAGPNWGSPLT